MGFDTKVSVRCTSEITSNGFFYKYFGALHLRGYFDWVLIQIFWYAAPQRDFEKILVQRTKTFVEKDAGIFSGAAHRYHKSDFISQKKTKRYSSRAGFWIKGFGGLHLND